MEGKVIGVTGAAQGIGFSIAQFLLERGAKVSIADISSEGLAAATEALNGGDNLLAVECNVKDLSSVQAWLQKTVGHFGRLDGAVNNAGGFSKCGQYDSRIVNQDDDDWHHIIALNLTGAMYCLREEMKIMRESGGGSIVNLSSYTGTGAGPTYGAYSAAKHGVIGLSKTAAKEMGREGIRVNVVAP